MTDSAGNFSAKFALSDEQTGDLKLGAVNESGNKASTTLSVDRAEGFCKGQFQIRPHIAMDNEGIELAFCRNRRVFQYFLI